MQRTEEEWESVVDKTFYCWQFSNAVETMDGKHISLFHPKGSGSEYYNYKGFFSLLILPLVDYDYKFMFIDVGCQRRISNKCVYNNSSLSNTIENNLLDLPPPHPLPISEDPEWILDHETECFSFMIVADDVFPLKLQIMKSYSHTNLDDKKLLFNYRASKYWRVKKNAFGICHAALDCSYLEHVCHQKLQSI